LFKPVQVKFIYRSL